MTGLSGAFQAFRRRMSETTAAVACINIWTSYYHAAQYLTCGLRSALLETQARDWVDVMQGLNYIIKQPSRQTALSPNNPLTKQNSLSLGRHLHLICEQEVPARQAPPLIGEVPLR